MIPFNLLPEEKNGHGPLSPEVDNQRREIWETILTKSNNEISDNTMKLMRELGSDLNINAFGINWRYPDDWPDRNESYHPKDGINKDLEEANYLMRRVVNRLSITREGQDPATISLFLTSTQFEPASYRQCARNFMERLQLTPCALNLWVLRNVVMNPFPTGVRFIKTLMEDVLHPIIVEEVEVLRKRNKPGERVIEFLLRSGKEKSPSYKVYLDFQTCFHRATQRQQIILEAVLDGEAYESYFESKKTNDTGNFEFRSDDCWNLRNLIKDIEDGKPKDVKGKIRLTGCPSIPCKVTMAKVIKSRPLNSANRDPSYPREFMPFYLYGTPGPAAEYHIAHMLLQAPNVDLSACNVQLDENLAEAVKNKLEKGLILTLVDYREETMQPFPDKNSMIGNDFFFRKDQKFKVDVYEDPNPASAEGPGLLDGLRSPIASGTMTLGQDIYIDVETMNKDPFEDDKDTLPEEVVKTLETCPYPEGLSWEGFLEDVKKEVKVPCNKKGE